MQAQVAISIPVHPPTEGDELYERTHGEVTTNTDDTPLIRAVCYTPDNIADHGLDGMFAGQSILLPVGGEFKYRLAILPLKLATHDVTVTNQWESDRDTVVVVKVNGSTTRRLERGRYTKINNLDATLTVEKK